MRNILIIGAGRSASYLIKYLLDKSQTENLHLTVGDLSLELAQQKTNNHPNATPIAFDIFDKNQRITEIQKAAIVISMLPAHLHIEIAKDCITYKKSMVTASYISEAMQNLDSEIKANNLIFMNEAGLDPGIDHMSAMKIMDGIRAKGGKITAFESFCGGLIAPESDNNLWNYKFTWAPRNVVLAGQGGMAKFMEGGQYKYLPYQNVFNQAKSLHIDGFGDFETYANRDSLKYQTIYGLNDIETLQRGTIRKAGFCKAWNMFVEIGMTDDTCIMENSKKMSYRAFTDAFLPYSTTDSVETKLQSQLGISHDSLLWKKLTELNLFNPDKIIGFENATPAQILEHILAESWALQPEDKDMVVMYHRFGYELNGKKLQIDSKMICIGENQTYTAMAKTVGLPIAMATLQILNGNIKTYGVQLPVRKEVYEPILHNLEEFGIFFQETEKIIPN